MTSLLISDTEAIRGYATSAMRASLALRSTSTSISALPLKPLTPDILREQGFGFTGADSLN